MSKSIVTKEFIRRRFDKLNAYYGPKGITPQLSLIRIETDFVNGKGMYDFDLKKQIPAGSPEVGLKRNDLFACTAIALATRIEDEDKPNISVPDFSPRLAKITTSGSAVTIDEPGFETNDVMALYNGSIFIQTGTIVNFSDLPTAIFLKQQSDDRTATSSDVAIRQKLFNLEDQMATLAEEIIFAGTQEHTIKVTFPSYASANYAAQQAKDSNGVVTSHNKAKLVFLALGYRVIGGTNEQYRVEENPFYGMI